MATLTRTFSGESAGAVAGTTHVGLGSHANTAGKVLDSGFTTGQRGGFTVDATVGATLLAALVKLDMTTIVGGGIDSPCGGVLLKYTASGVAGFTGVRADVKYNSLVSGFQIALSVATAAGIFYSNTWATPSSYPGVAAGAEVQVELEFYLSGTTPKVRGRVWPTLSAQPGYLFDQAIGSAGHAINAVAGYGGVADLANAAGGINARYRELTFTGNWQVAPDAPAVTVSGIGATVATMTGAAFNDANGDGHAATEFRVRDTADDAILYGPVEVSTPGALLSIQATGLPENTSGLVAEMRYKDNSASALWGSRGTSAPFATLPHTQATLPVYRATVYEKRTSAVDPETTPMVPRDADVHSDPFQVASQAGVDGFYPALDVNLRGRRGSLDPLEKRVDVGELTIRVGDPRLAAGDNTQRWLTAFLGDANGNERLKGRKVLIEESLDGGVTWAAFFTGRVRSAKLAGRIVWSIQVRDMAQDMATRVFIGRPDTSVAYARPAVLIPNGFITAGYGGVRPTRPVLAVMERSSHYTPLDPSGGPRTFGEMKVTERSNVDPPRITTKVLTDYDNWSLYTGDRDYSGPLRIFMRPVGDPDWGEFRPTPVSMPAMLGDKAGKAIISLPKLASWSAGRIFKTVEIVGLQALPVGSTNYAAIPADGTAVEFYITGDGKPTDKFPLFIADVHPVQLWKDLLDGKFGYLVNGGARRTVAYDAAAFTALIADTSIPLQRFRITKPWKLVDFIEEAICKPNNLAYRLDENGQVVPLDLRMPHVLPTLTVTDADATLEDAPGWETDQGTVITRVEATYYAEERRDPTQYVQDSSEYPDENGGTVTEVDPAPLYIPADLAAEAELGSVEKYEVNALGFRFFPDELAPLAGNADNLASSGGAVTRSGTRTRQEWIRAWLDRLAADVRGLFGNGAKYLDLVAGRTAVTNQLQVGVWAVVNVSVPPNMASNYRGGARVMLCTERTEDGPRVNLSFLDAGSSLVAVSPTLGAVAQTAGLTTSSASLLVTLNVLGEPVTVDVAQVGTADARPAEGSALWMQAARVTATGNLVLTGLQSGRRIYVRARSWPDEGTARKLPSPYVFPSGAGYVNLASLTAPTGLAVSSITVSSGEATWTNASADYATEVFLYQGASAPASWESYLVATLPPGSTRYLFEDLTGPAVNYTLGLRHRMATAFSSVAEESFSTNTTPQVCPTPYGLALATPST
jgi:hypothetical protein